MTDLKVHHISPIFPGARDAIGLEVDGYLRANCIGSGDNLRDAKASALRHLRQIIQLVRDLPDTPLSA